ncbi:hypothetical protein H6S82_22950 [Planktothrix sp. FACHB-1355]|nr:hypothetical protein [Planktothrix sp. FACHB-1355]
MSTNIEIQSQSIGEFTMRSLPHTFPSMAFLLLIMAGYNQTQIAVGLPSYNLAETAHNPAIIAENLTMLGREIAAGNEQLGLQLFDRAVQVAETIEDRSTKIEALSNIAIKLAEVGQTQKARQLLDRAVQLTRKTDENFTLYQQDPALRDVAIKVAQAGFTERALQLTQTLASNTRKAEALNAIASILAEKGELETARKILLQALQKARGITGDYAYESNGSCGNEKFEILAKIAGNLSLLSQFDTALQVAKSVTGCSSATGESGENYQAWAYLGILAHMANANQVKQAWASSQNIQNDVEKAEVWSAIAVKLAGMNEVNLARSIAAQISEKIPTTTKIDSGSALRELGVKEKALRNIAVKLAEVGQFDAAKQVAETIHELTPAEIAANQDFNLGNQAREKAFTFVEIARQLAKAKQIEPALQIVNSIENGEIKALGIIAIAQELHTAGQAPQAENLLSQNLQLPAISNPDDFAVNQSIIRIAEALVKAGQIERSLQIAESLKKDDSKQEALTNIAVQLAEIGQVDRALQIANTLSLLGLKESALTKIASKYLEIGQLDRAVQVAQSLEENNKANILAKIVDAFAKLGNSETALQVAQTIPSQEIKANAIANIAARTIKSK